MIDQPLRLERKMKSSVHYMLKCISDTVCDEAHTNIERTQMSQPSRNTRATQHGSIQQNNLYNAHDRSERKPQSVRKEGGFAFKIDEVCLIMAWAGALAQAHSTGKHGRFTRQLGMQCASSPAVQSLMINIADTLAGSGPYLQVQLLGAPHGLVHSVQRRMQDKLMQVLCLLL